MSLAYERRPHRMSSAAKEVHVAARAIDAAAIRSVLEAQSSLDASVIVNELDASGRSALVVLYQILHNPDGDEPPSTTHTYGNGVTPGGDQAPTNGRYTGDATHSIHHCNTSQLMLMPSGALSYKRWILVAAAPTSLHDVASCWMARSSNALFASCCDSRPHHPTPIHTASRRCISL
jgi:hypothetical protein